VRLWWIALACLGCGKLLSFDKVDPGIDAPTPTHFTLDYTLRTVSDDATGIQTVDEVRDPTSLLVRLPDGTTPELAHTAPGTYEFDAVTDRYELQLLGIGATYPASLQHTATSLHVVEESYGRLDFALPTQNTVVDISGIPVTAGTVAWQLFTSGVFASLDLTSYPGGVPTRTPTLNWRTDVHGIGLLSAAEHDRLYYAEYSNVGGLQTLTGYVRYDTLTLPDGSRTNLGGTPISPPLRTAQLTAPLASELARISPSLVTQADPPAIGYGVLALFGDVLSGGTALPLASRAVTTPTDLTASTIKFCNPIDGTSASPVLVVVSARQIVAPGTRVGWPFTTQLAVIAPAYTATGSATELATIPGNSVGVMGGAALEGVPLSADGTIVSADLVTKAELTWSVMSGALDYYVVTLYELTNIQNQTYPAYIDTISTVTPDVVLPGALLQAGHTYAIVITGVLGVPGAAQGDFRDHRSAGGFEIYIPGAFTPALPTPGG
jgi:hypothetical protein